jgi:cysteinyl-tRNA synthetase
VSIKLYNTLTRKLDELPEPPGPVRMYFCGSTVYQRIHVGNARPFLFAMWLRRWLRVSGYQVVLVHNITDVDDKVYAEAAKQGLPSRELSERATGWFFADTDALGLGRPDFEPRATETIEEIIDFIEQLIAEGHAYAANGDVYFSVASFPEYGRLSGAKLEEMVAQETSDLKRDQRDFALWKSQKPEEDTAWDSPWGPGRPGWHIECSAMAEKFLGPAFELHGGGLDLVFPHHENELAQSRSLGHQFARIWTHNGLLQITGEKMAKSVGNIVTLRDAIDEWGRETLLLLFLGAHWHNPMDFSEETLAQAAARADRFREVFRNPSVTAPAGAWEQFAGALDNDFNTPEALAAMHEWRDHELLLRALDVFGLQSLAKSEEAPAEVVQLAERRQGARSNGDFAEADRLRGEIDDAGWEVRDVPEGFRLVRK